MADRRDARAQAEVGRRVRSHGDATLGQKRAFVLAQPDAVGHGETRRQQADLVEETHDALREVSIQPDPLAPAFEQILVHPPAGPLRSLGDQRERALGAPLWPDRAILDVDPWPGMGGRYCVHPCELLLGRRVARD